MNRLTSKSVIPAGEQNPVTLATLVYDETGKIPDNPDIPIKRYFGEFLEKLTAGAARK